jgi:hypothetical protein
MWLLGSQDPIPDTADTGRHLMRMESEDKRGSATEETRNESTTREMGIIFPETQDPNEESNERDGNGAYLFSYLGDSRQGLPSQLHHRS